MIKFGLDITNKKNCDLLVIGVGIRNRGYCGMNNLDCCLLLFVCKGNIGIVQLQVVVFPYGVL